MGHSDSVARILALAGLASKGSSSSGGGTSDYNSLQNRPSINGIQLTGNKTTSDLKIVVPTKVSELANDANYVQTSDVYDKTQIDAKMATKLRTTDIIDGGIPFFNKGGALWHYRK